MALPALELHQPLDRLAIHGESLLAKKGPNQAITEIELSVDQMLHPLRQDVVDHSGSITRSVVDELHTTFRIRQTIASGRLAREAIRSAAARAGPKGMSAKASLRSPSRADQSWPAAPSLQCGAQLRDLCDRPQGVDAAAMVVVGHLPKLALNEPVLPAGFRYRDQSLEHVEDDSLPCAARSIARTSLARRRRRSWL